MNNKNSMKRVGVTGGSGFIASYVIDELLERGYEVVAFDHHKKPLHRDSVEVFMGDMRDDVAMTEFAAHVDGIIHLAGVLGTQETIKNPRPAAESNLMGGLNFLEAVAQYDIPGVYIAVGNHWFNNTYSISKNMIERFTHMFNKERGTRVNIVRAVNAYGPRQSVAAPYGSSKVRKITPSLVCRYIAGDPMELYGGGQQISDMVYVGDVATALVLALEKANEGVVLDRAVEIGSVNHTKIIEVAQLVETIGKRKGIPPVDIVTLPMRPGEKEGEVVTADISTLSLIGFDPADLTPLYGGLEKTIDYYIETEGSVWRAKP